MVDIIEKEIGGVVNRIVNDYSKGREIDKMTIYDMPDKQVITDIADKLIKIIFPGYYKEKVYRILNPINHIVTIIEDVAYNLNKQISIVLKYSDEFKSKEGFDAEKESQKLVLEFLNRIPAVRELAETDLQAAFDGDPAAASMEEIVYSYPGLYAITVNRLAHELFLLGVPLIPRIMTEMAHSKTGIDIHPGATIGKYFFIDHGTGIVVGETTEIGDNVKIYQGVTLGALSTRGGQSLRHKKRHPTIEDNVTIYSGASILGGETVIGKNVVIGGNVFITKSVSANTKVSAKSQELIYNNDSTEVVDIEMDERFWTYII